MHVPFDKSKARSLLESVIENAINAKRLLETNPPADGSVTAAYELVDSVESDTNTLMKMFNALNLYG